MFAGCAAGSTSVMEDRVSASSGYDDEHPICRAFLLSDFQNQRWWRNQKRGDVALALYPSKALYLNGYVENSKPVFRL